jgi:hypothetical protein
MNILARRAAPPLLNDQPGQPQPGPRRQRGINVGHEGLLDVKWLLDTSTPQPEAFTRQPDSPTPNRTTSLDITPSTHELCRYRLYSVKTALRAGRRSAPGAAPRRAPLRVSSLRCGPLRGVLSPLEWFTVRT